MKKLNKEEVDKIMIAGRGRQHTITQHAVNLEIGEALLISKEEWIGKNSPHYLIYSINKKHPIKLTCKLLADGTAWLVCRIS
jgi:hypothetical protein